MASTTTKSPSTPPAFQGRNLLRAIGLIAAAYILLRFLWITRALLIITVFGVLFGLILSTAAGWLERFRIKRAFGAPIIALLFLAVVTAIFSLFGPTLQDQTRQLQRRLPEAIDRIEQWLTRNPDAIPMMLGGEAAAIDQAADRPADQKKAADKRGAAPAANEGPAAASTTTDAQKPAASGPAQAPQPAGSSLRALATQQLGAISRFLFPFVSVTATVVGALVLVLFIAIYIAIDPDLYREGLLHLFPHRMRPRATEVLNALGDTMRQWLVARLIAMVAVGTVTGIALTIIGIPAAFPLAVLAALLEFIPFFGPIIASIPAVALGFLESPQTGAWVIVAFVLIQQLEGNVITPLAMQNRVDVPPALTVIAVAALGIVFGFLGLLIAEPLVAATLLLTRLLYVEDVVGDEIA